jgi:pimeloyl-ACP methyl ester carboxylesterase
VSRPSAARPATALGDRHLRAQSLSVDGESLFVEVIEPLDVRDPSTIVLSHGAGGCHLAFFAQAGELSASHRVVLWDQRGFGASSSGTGRTGPRVAAGDLIEVIDQVAGRGRVHVVGQSMGAWAAVGAALENPERIASLVLSGSIGGMFSDVTRKSLDAFIAAMSESSERPSVAGASAALGPAFASQRPAQALLYQMIGLLPGPGVAAVKEIRATEFDVADVAALQLPMLFVAGVQDEIFPVDEVARLAERIPSARLVPMPGSGHSPYFEEPDAFNRAVARFIAQVEGRRSR